MEIRNRSGLLSSDVLGIKCRRTQATVFQKFKALVGYHGKRGAGGKKGVRFGDSMGNCARPSIECVMVEKLIRPECNMLESFKLQFGN